MNFRKPALASNGLQQMNGWFAKFTEQQWPWIRNMRRNQNELSIVETEWDFHYSARVHN